MATTFDKDISMELTQDEDLLWQGKPQKASFVLSKSIQLLPIAIIWLCFDGFAIAMVTRSKMPPGMVVFLIIFFAIHLMPVWLWIHSIIRANKNHKNIEYAFTSKRVIVRNVNALTSYYYHTLSNVHVKVGLIDKLFKVGDINISGNKTLMLLDIENPYAVGQKLQQFIDTAKEKRSENIDEEIEYEEYHEYDEDLEVRIPYDRRYTSRPALQQKNDEDEYLDNIMDSINKKDDF